MRKRPYYTITNNPEKHLGYEGQELVLKTGILLPYDHVILTDLDGIDFDVCIHDLTLIDFK